MSVQHLLPEQADLLRAKVNVAYSAAASSPQQKHPFPVGRKLAEDLGYPGDVVHAVHAHNDYFGLPRNDLMSRVVFACDELTGLITATALVRPNKSILGLAASSVRKKMKDKAFARGVNREDIVKGAEQLGVDLNEHIAFVIAAMEGEADALGLRGTPA